MLGPVLSGQFLGIQAWIHGKGKEFAKIQWARKVETELLEAAVQRLTYP
mgnify:CR=1 FL=1